LSQADAYERIDVIASAERAWRKRFHKPAPDFAVEEQEGIQKVLWDTASRSLIVKVRNPKKPEHPTSLRIPASGFLR
jgi:hypothetical protein